MLVFFALTLVVLLGFCGLAVDVGLLQLKQLRMQNAADAAATGAAYSLGNGDPKATWQAAGQSDAVLNGFTNAPPGTVVDPEQISFNGASAIQATITQSVNPIFFSGARTVSAQATALVPSSAACSYFLLQYAGQPSMDITGANLNGSCSVYLGNYYKFSSASSYGLQYLAVNLSQDTSSGGTVTPAAKSSATMTDPLNGQFSSSSRPATHCDITGDQTISSSNPLMPNTYYCGNIKINSPTTLAAGTYSISGSVTVSSNLTGSNVTFFIFSYPSVHTYGVFSFSSGATINLSAPTSGLYRGILFFSDPNLPSGQTSGTSLLSITGSNGTMDGIIYLPHQNIYFASGNLKGNNYFGMDADWLKVGSGNLTFSSDYSSIGGSPFGPAAPALVQ